MYRFWHKFRNWASVTIGHLLIEKRHDDRFLVSYPRSGNTWMRTILANILFPGANSNPDVFNEQLPGVSIRNAKVINQLPSPRIIKSHSWYRPHMGRVVYLLRDGRDAITSFYHYVTTRHGHERPFVEFFELYCDGYYGWRWDQHVRSWLETGKHTLGDNLLVVKFEYLKKDTISAVREVTRFLNVAATSSQMEDAVAAASLDRMRKIELQRGDVTLQKPDAYFYRQGKLGQWQDFFTPDIEERFLELSADVLSLAEYRI